ncbi:MAG: hypothetical protein KGN78_07425 [Actinomycetales bacterium]|nr:hypothetical protein [Actinomycetales bacterium]
MSSRAASGTGALVAGVIVMLSSALLAAGWTLAIGDWVARNAEMARLIQAIEGSEAAMVATQEEVTALMQQHAQDAEGGELIDGLGDAAGRGRDSIAYAGTRVQGVAVLPWHTSIDEAKQAYLAHNAAWQEYLDRASGNPSEFVTPQPLVDSTFAAAEPLLRAAVPLLDLWDFGTRIDVIYTPPEGATADDGPGQQVRVVHSAL